MGEMIRDETSQAARYKLESHARVSWRSGLKMPEAAFRRPPCIVHVTGFRQSLRRAHFLAAVFLPAFLAVFLAAFFAVFLAAFFAAFFLAAMVGSLELVTLLVSE